MAMVDVYLHPWLCRSKYEGKGDGSCSQASTSENTNISSGDGYSVKDSTAETINDSPNDGSIDHTVYCFYCLLFIDHTVYWETTEHVSPGVGSCVPASSSKTTDVNTAYELSTYTSNSQKLVTEEEEHAVQLKIGIGSVALVRELSQMLRSTGI